MKLAAILDAMAREYFEGSNFMDITAWEDPVDLHVVKLRKSGRAWVDFTRAVQEITLFGRGSARSSSQRFLQ